MYSKYQKHYTTLVSSVVKVRVFTYYAEDWEIYLQFA